MEARRRRDDREATAWAAPRLLVAARRPAQEGASEHEPGRAVEQDERSVRELLRLPLVHAPPGDAVSEPLQMEPPVELVGARRAREAEEAAVVRVPALGARPVSCGERSGVVEEEEARVAARRHRSARPPATAELQPAGDPPLRLPLPPDDPGLVVEAATIAVDEPALGRLDQLAERRDAVAQRHQTVRTILPSCSPASSRSCAARISSSGSTESTTGRARPGGDLGPRYRVVYRVPGPSGSSTVVQDVYPYARTPVTFMRPGQRFWGGARTHGGWFVSEPRLKAMLVAAGLPESRPSPAASFPWAWTGAGVVAVVLLLLLVLRRRSAVRFGTVRSTA